MKEAAVCTLVQPRCERQDGVQRDPHDRAKGEGRDNGTMQGRRLAGRQRVEPSGRGKGSAIESPDGVAYLCYRVQHGKAMGRVLVESVVMEV